MTREPVEPLSGEEAPRVGGAGGPPPPIREAVDERGARKPADESAVALDWLREELGDQGAVPSPSVRLEPWRLSHLMITVAVVAVVLWFFVTLRALAIIITPVGLIVLGITAGFVMARMRATRQEALLSLLAIAAEKGMPMAPAVSAFADQFRGRSQRRILQVVAELEAGKPLPEALGEGLPYRPPDPYRLMRLFFWGRLGERVHDEMTRRRPTVSRDALLMIRVGQETGRLVDSLRLACGSRPARVGTWTSIASRLAYLLTVMLVAEFITSFQMYFIVPKFEAIFADFGTPLPDITIFLIMASHYAVRYAPVSLTIFLAQLGLLLFLPFSFGGWMNYKVPIFDRLLPRRHAALVLRALSLVIGANEPIAVGLRILAERYPTPWFRRRLVKASAEVRMGADWIDTLWRVGVIRQADAEVLASAATVGNLAWACRELADTAERRQQFRMQMVTQTLFPLAILAIGVAVATLCLGYFVPLVTLIQRLAG